MNKKIIKNIKYITAILLFSVFVIMGKSEVEADNMGVCVYPGFLLSSDSGKMAVDDTIAYDEQQFVYDLGGVKHHAGEEAYEHMLAESSSTPLVVEEVPDISGYRLAVPLPYRFTVSMKTSGNVSLKIPYIKEGGKINIKESEEVMKISPKSKNVEYKGEQTEIALTVSFKGGPALEEGRDYTVSYGEVRKNSDQDWTLEVFVNGMGDFTGNTAIDVPVSVDPNDEINQEKTVELSNPKVENGIATWDCVWFGSYPQAEVVQSNGYDAVDAKCIQDGDIIVDSGLYQSLENASGWDVDGDITLNGEQYRRIMKTDAVYSADNSSTYYRWDDGNTYHYFKYLPIKWRVLKTDGNTALLLADKVLDECLFNTSIPNPTWEKSQIRSFLNGYEANYNQPKVDFSIKRNFLYDAFESKERDAIHVTEVVQSDSEYSMNGGKNTKDKIFLLSHSEAINYAYGFSANNENANVRESKTSTYAKAMGAVWSTSANSYGNGYWWLRTSGRNVDTATGVDDLGGLGTVGVIHHLPGVRPALVLDLKQEDVYSYAQSVQGKGASMVSNDLNAKSISIKAAKSSIGVGETTTVKATMVPSNAKSTYTFSSMNPKIASVSQKGAVKGLKEGKATIKVVTSNGKTAKVTITVKSVKVKPKSLKLSKKKITVKKGKTAKIGTTVKPKNCTYKISFKSQNKKIAAVSSKGIVKGVKKGKTTITVKVGSLSKKVTVLVR